MKLEAGARVAVIGAGPSGLVTAKHLLAAGFDVTVLESADDLGGQWKVDGPTSGVWAGMPTNTSRMMTAFYDLPPEADLPLHPAAEQIHAYLHRYADTFGISERIRYGTTVHEVRPGWYVDGEPFDAVVAASGRFRRPRLVEGLAGFSGETLHAFDYPGPDHFRGRRVLVYGNGISGLEIASDLAPTTEVVSAYRKPRYVLQKRVDDTPSDWQWYTRLGALQRRFLARDRVGSLLRDHVLEVAGNPRDYGAPEPDRDIFVSGNSLCQDYLSQVAAGQITSRPAIASVDGRTVTFTDGTTEHVDVLLTATGYELDVPYLADAVWAVTGPDLRLHLRTTHPALPGFAAVGMFLAQGPYFPLLELQAMLAVATFTDDLPADDPATARRSRTTSRTWSRTTCSPASWPRRSGSSPTRATTRTSPRRSCSAPCCPRATTSRVAPSSRRQPTSSPSSSPPHPRRGPSPTTGTPSPTSASPDLTDRLM